MEAVSRMVCLILPMSIVNAWSDDCECMLFKIYPRKFPAPSFYLPDSFNHCIGESPHCDLNARESATSLPYPASSAINFSDCPLFSHFCTKPMRQRWR